MSLPVAFHRAARAEFIAASAWYETKREGLAVEFITEIERCITLAATHLRRFATTLADIRRVAPHRFRSSVYFRTEQHRLVVLAVFHSSRAPAIWQTRN